MRQYLVHHRCEAAVREQVVDVGPFEVGDTDRTELAGTVGVFKRTPGLGIASEIAVTFPELRPRLRAVDQHEIDVIETQRLQRSVDALPSVGVALALGYELGRQ